MSLIVWCGADQKVLKQYMGQAIAQAMVEHTVVKDMTTFPVVEPGDVVLAAGTKALTVLQGLKLVPKGRTVTSMREKVLKHNDATILCTFDPGVCNRDYARVPELQWDVQLAARVVKTGSTRPQIGEYRWVESFHEMILKVEELYAKTGKPVDVACDTETLSLVEYNPDAWIISISFTVEEGKSDAMYFTKREKPIAPPPFYDIEEVGYWEGVWLQIHWLLTTEKISLRGANWKYDSRWIREKWGIACTNHRFDTLLVGSLLDETRSNSLKLHAKIMTPMGGYEDDMAKYDFSRLDLVPKEELIDYMGGDTDATYRVAIPMKKELLRDRALSNFYIKLLHPASHVFEKMERTGILVDVPYYQKLQVELECEIDRLHGSMLDLLPNKLRIKYKDKIADCLDQNKMPLTPDILKEFLFTSAGLNLKPQIFTEKTKEPSTSLDHLMMFESDPVAAAFISLFREHGSAAKTYSTYVVGFLKHLRPDGRFHPTYLLSRMDYGGDDGGTVTGRCLTAEARILTDKGEIPIKELVERGEQGEAFKVLTHKNRWLPVTGYWRNGVKPVCTVKASGRQLTSTYNHPYMSFPSWTLAEDLKLGAWLYSVVEPPKVEEWRPIAGWPFEVSNMGRVRRAIDGHGVVAGQEVPSRAKGIWGHRMVSLTKFDNGREKIDVPVHKLVADAFLTNKGGVEIAHLNGDAACNWSTNLKWVSVEENKLHFRLHGNAQHDNQKKLDWETVDALRAGMWGNNHQAAEALGVSRELVRDVRLFKKWNGRRDSMTGFMPIRVDSVKDAGVQETFDLTVDEDHSFIANGLVVHNTSAKDPAVQTIPKHTKWTKKLRRAYIPPPGYTILQLDYSQGELRITAVVAREPTMIQAYRDGMDLHAITAAQLNGYEMADFLLLPEEVRDELRSGGKAGNFGLIYGMQHLGFREYAYTSYGVVMTEEEAFNKREAFFGLYNRLPEWHDEYKAYAHLHGYVRSPLGRVRHLPLINSPDNEMRSQSERQSINSPIQSCLSDMMQLAMVHIDRQYGDCDIHPFLMTHDSLALYVPVDDATIWAKRLKNIMENLPLEKDFGWRSPLQFISDAEMSAVGDDGIASLATLKKLKGL